MRYEKDVCSAEELIPLVLREVNSFEWRSQTSDDVIDTIGAIGVNHVFKSAF